MRNYLIMILCLVILSSANADWTEFAKLVADDANDDDNWGTVIDFDGDYAAIGVSEDDDNGSNCGAVYIFKKHDSDWLFMTKLYQDLPVVNDRFGVSVAIDANLLVVGATGAEASTLESGAAFIFERNGETWTQQLMIGASDGENYDNFGRSVSISGNYILVGSPIADSPIQTSCGAAYIYEKPTGGWQSSSGKETQKISANETTGRFGWSVAIEGDLAIVGAWQEGHVHSQDGAAFCFKRDTTSWSQWTKLISSEPIDSAHLGYSVSIDNNTVIAGANHDDHNGECAGAAYIFELPATSSATCYENHILLASDANEYDNFGFSVGIANNYAIVGAYADDVNGLNSGSAYIFKFNGTSWSQQNKLLPTDKDSGDSFGHKVAISGIQALIGAPYDDDVALNGGSVYYFRGECPKADLSGDCFVDFVDFAEFASEWLTGDKIIP